MQHQGESAALIYVKCSGGSGSSRGTDPVSIKLKRRHRPGLFCAASIRTMRGDPSKRAWSLLLWHKADVIFVGMNVRRQEKSGHRRSITSDTRKVGVAAKLKCQH